MKAIKIKLTNVDYKEAENCMSLRELGYQAGDVLDALWNAWDGSAEIQLEDGFYNDAGVSIARDTFWTLTNSEYEVA